MNPTIIERKERWARKRAGQERPAVRSHDRLPPGQHLSSKLQVLDLGIQPVIPLDQWKLEIKGLVDNPITLSWDELNKLEQFEDVSDFHCVTTWSKYDCRWAGVSFFTLADLVRPTPEAKFVYFTGYDGYSTNTAIEHCLDDDTLIATSLEGRPIPKEHGGPARVIIPKLYAWKGSKFLRGIEFRADDKPGFWEVRGYSNTADPWTEDRFS